MKIQGLKFQSVPPTNDKTSHHFGRTASAIIRLMSDPDSSPPLFIGMPIKFVNKVFKLE